MHHLYIIQSDVTGAFKVGRSKNVQKRLKQLQTGSPYKLKLILELKHQGYIEKQLHEILKIHKCRKNGEWFDFAATGYLPDEITEMLDLDVVNSWWNHHLDVHHA